MSLTVQEAAHMLGIAPETVHRWARQGLLGLRQPSGELTFERGELERWARSRGLSVRAAGESPPAPPAAAPRRPLFDALARGAVLRSRGGATVEDTLRRLVGELPLAAPVDRGALLEQLLNRERLASTGLGHGVALPHPRTPSASLGREPAVFLALLDQPVDWKAVDAQPVHSLFLLLSPTPAEHLQVLARLAFLLRDPEFCRLLAERASDQEIQRCIAAKEPAGI